MKLMNFIILSHKGVKYKINLDKLNFVISNLEQKEVNISNEHEAELYLNKYTLFNEEFLKNINKI